MRYDFGKVYKEIRKSKGLTQEEVCGNVISRTSLSKIESGKVTPKYENMEFLLRQINMSFEEFDYICHLYQPSQRTEIMQTYLNMSSILGTSELENYFKNAKTIFKTHHDLPYRRNQGYAGSCHLSPSTWYRATVRPSETDYQKALGKN